MHASKTGLTQQAPPLARRGAAEEGHHVLDEEEDLSEHFVRERDRHYRRRLLHLSPSILFSLGAVLRSINGRLG